MLTPYTWLFFFLISSGSIIAQQVINTAGGHEKNHSGSLSYSLGQVVYLASTNASLGLQEGVQQAYPQTGSGMQIEELSRERIRLALYPNPTDKILHVALKETKLEAFTYQVLNAQGRLKIKGALLAKQSTLSFAHLSPGLYLFRLYQQGRLIQSFKIIKK